MQLFDGRCDVSALSMERPFGVAPTLSADIALDDLDLLALTEVFGFGSITGAPRWPHPTTCAWSTGAPVASTPTCTPIQRGSAGSASASARCRTSPASATRRSSAACRRRLIGAVRRFRLSPDRHLLPAGRTRSARWAAWVQPATDLLSSKASGLPRLNVVGFNRRRRLADAGRAAGGGQQGEVKPVIRVRLPNPLEERSTCAAGWECRLAALALDGLRHHQCLFPGGRSQGSGEGIRRQGHRRRVPAGRRRQPQPQPTGRAGRQRVGMDAGVFDPLALVGIGTAYAQDKRRHHHQDPGDPGDPGAHGRALQRQPAAGFDSGALGFTSDGLVERARCLQARAEGPRRRSTRRSPTTTAIARRSIAKSRSPTATRSGKRRSARRFAKQWIASAQARLVVPGRGGSWKQK